MSESTDTAGIPDVDSVEVEPIPRRFWWLKRIAVGFGVLIVVLAGLRWWWGWEGHRRLQARIDRYVAAGEPVYPEDFDSKPVPNDQNAAWMLDEAIIALNLTAEQDRLVQAVSERFALTSAELGQVQEAIEANAEFFRLVRAARDAPGIDWGTRIRSLAFSYLLPGLASRRQAGKFLATAAMYHHATGSHETAIEVLRDALAHAEAFDRQPFLITHLVATASCALVVESIERVTATLSVEEGDGDMGRAGNSPDRAQVRSLIADLLDEAAYGDSVVRAVHCERMLLLDFVLCLRGEGYPAAVGMWGGSGVPAAAHRLFTPAIGPLLEFDGARILDYTTALAEAAGKETYPRAVAVFPAEPASDSVFGELAHPLSCEWLSSLERSILLSFRHRAMRRMAATALAVRLYELDHGRRPAELDELVPEYLPVVPLDPFGSSEMAISYSPDADPPILYSVGPNGVDDGGTYALHRSGGVDWNELDMPFFLDGNRPRPGDEDDSNGQPSTEAGEDEQQEQDEQRRGEEQSEGQEP